MSPGAVDQAERIQFAVTKDRAREAIEKELSTASQAASTGNDGMMRVCARRAAGIAIVHWLEHNPRPDWGTDAMNRLRNLQLEGSIPHAVREAAGRLTAKVSEDFTYSSTSNPIHDAKLIIDYMLG
jgi:hypothetical protein